MAEEIKPNEGGAPSTSGMTEDYIAQIQKLKENSVPKEDYENMKEENRKLLESLVNGSQVSASEKTEQVDVDALRKDLFSGEKELNNLEGWTKTLQLRDELIKRGARDPFLPFGHDVVPTQEDIECADRVADVVKECIEYADGDSSIFTNELMRRTVDSAPVRRK